MFNVVVRRLGGLARIPLAPQVFDAGLVAWTALFHRRRLDLMETLESRVRQWSGVDRAVHRRGGIEFRIEGREFAHLHGNGLLDIRLGPAQAAAAVGSNSVHPHHVLGRSAWVSIWLREEADLSAALRWMREACNARNSPRCRVAR